MIAKMKKIKKDSRENIFFSVLILLLIFLVIGFLIYSNLKISQKRTELLTKIENLKKEIQILEEKNEELRAGIEKTESEDYQKEKLYEQGYIEKGEKQVVVLPPKAAEKEKTSEQKNFWQRLLDPVRSLWQKK
jgi:cell division protein FtsB